MHKAKKEKNDEFYTQLTDIEKEMKHYKEHFKGKVVFCNCDDPEWSNFWKYFELNFTHLGLKKLVATHFKQNEPSYKLEIIGDENGDGVVNHLDIIKTPLQQNGDFRSPEAIAILEEADIVVTNPPFSLFREYIAQLIKYNKKFLVIGNMNAIGNNEVFKAIKENRVWLGNTAVKAFKQPDGTIKTFGNVCWFTNLPHKKRNESIDCWKQYTEKEYLKYINYDAIEVSKIKNIPADYIGNMGVPITFLDRYNPDQFEIIGIANDKREVHEAFVQGEETYLDDKHKKFVGMVLKDGGKLRAPYSRIIIKRK